jgi:hypothetical protein
MNPILLKMLKDFAASNSGMAADAAKAAVSVSKWKKVFDAVKNEAKEMYDAVSKEWIELNDIAMKTARTMAMSREQAVRYNEYLIKSTKELAAQYGVSAKELAEFQKSYSEAVGRNVTLTQEQLAHMSTLSKITDSATAAQLVDDFDKLGLGIEGSTAKIGLMQERAKALGINATKATKALRDNIKLAASYSFKNGVNDIEKMALRATSLRMEMNAITNAMDKFMNIEDAITTSANLQMLGGSWAASFANPMGAMYEATADPEAFMKRLEKTIAGKGRYDEKTGTVQFDPVTMMTMREAAKQLGMSVEQLTNPAMAKVQNEKVIDELRRSGTLGGWSDKELEAIQNLSRTNVDSKTGKHYVTILDKDGEEQKIEIEKLTRDQLKVAQDTKLTEEGLFSDVQDIKEILERVHRRARETKSYQETADALSEWWKSTVANLEDIHMQWIDAGRNAFSNWLGTRYFAKGGIAGPVHAEGGTVVPGTSYYGDKVPAMVNSGEMIINQKQQKGLFSLISSLGLQGGMLYGANKLGGKFGYRGLGSTMLLASALGGGDMDMTSLIEAHFIKKAIKSFKPLKESIGEVGKASEAASQATSTFGSRWKELTSTMSRDFTSLHKKVSGAAKRYLTTGKLGKVTRFGGKIASGVASWGRFSLEGAKVVGEWIGKYTVKPIAKGAKWLANTEKVLKARQFVDEKAIRTRLGYRDFRDKIVKPKSKEYSRLIKNLFNDGSSAQASKEASRMAGTVSKETSSVAKAVGKGGKLLSGVGKAGKLLSKRLPYIGTALAIGGAVSGMVNASSQYDAKIEEIESSGMTDIEKARAKDRATKQKNEQYGSSVGSAAGGIGGLAAGAAAGAAIGSVVPVIGTAIGGLIGGALGAWGGESIGSGIGKLTGGLFGGSEEEKYLEQQKEMAKAAAGNSEEVVKVLKSIEGKMPTTSSIASNFGLKGPELSSSVLSSLPVIGSMFTGIKALTGGLSDKPTSSAPSEIKLNVSGTIKLEANGGFANLDVNKLLENKEFVRKITDIVTKTMASDGNAGKKPGNNGRGLVTNAANAGN